jgi:uncharacterized membrane protein
VKRINSIDICRGVVMIIMALDHVRDLLHFSSAQNATDLSKTTAAIFFTRWITHICAPTFVFLSGTSAYIFCSRQGFEEGRKFLLTRGLWLIIVEFTIINFGLWFDIRFHTLIFEVIGAIGFSFIILGLCLRLTATTLGIIGTLIVFLHNLFPLLPFADGSMIREILTPLFTLTLYTINPDHFFLVGYAPIPWLGIMLIGFACGQYFAKLEGDRKKLFLRIGIGSLSLFVLLRLLNFYGDFPWSTQKNFLFTVFSFVNITKYPPSLMFTLLTLGAMFMIVSFAEGRESKLKEIALTYGKVPMFYFIVHFYFIHLIMVAVLFLQGFHWSDFNFGPFSFGRPKTSSGVGLIVVYLIWIGVVIIMYPMCKWYGTFKSQHPENKLLKYL